MAQQTIDIIQLKHPDTGDVFYPQTHAEGVVGLGTAATTDSDAYATATQGSHADTIYNLINGNKNVNTVLAGPSSGSAGAASFRKLVAADIPNLDWSKINVEPSDIVSTLGTTAVNRATADANGNIFKDYYVTLSTAQTISGTKTFSTINTPVFKADSGSYYFYSATNAIAYAPLSWNAWHDHFAFLRTYTIISVQNSSDGTTWVDSDTNIKNLFTQKEAVTVPILKASDLSFRFTLQGSNLHAWQVSWFAIGVNYTNPFSAFDILIECSSDNTNWTTLATNKITGGQRTYFLKADDTPANQRYIRITFTKTSNLTTGTVALNSINALTLRKGNQGQGKEYQVPYNWDSEANLLPIYSTSCIGSTSSRWSTFYGTDSDLTGKITVPKIRINTLHSSSSTDGGIYYNDGTTDYLLIGQGSVNLWIGANETSGRHHPGGTFISAGTGDVKVSRLVSGTRTNYTVLDEGNYNSYALPLTGGTMTGAIKRYYTTASTDPFIFVASKNLDVWLWRISHTDAADSAITTNKATGFGLKYLGTGSDVNNNLALYADNQTGAQVAAVVINQSGQLGIGTNPNTSYRVYVNGNSYFSGTATITGNTSISGTLTVASNKATSLGGTLTVSGNTTLSSNVYLGTSATTDTDWANGQYLQWDASHKAWHLIGNFYADGFVSAGGWSDGSGTSGIDWEALATNDSSHKIDVSHIPNITTSKITDLESWISEKGYVTSSGITSVVKGTATSGGAVSTSGGTVTIQFPTAYSLPIASSSTLGGIKVGSGLSINATTGVLSATYSYTLPTASADVLGGIKVGSGLSIDSDGVLSATYSYTLPTASSSVLGGIKVGSGLAITNAGVLSATYSYTLPLAANGTRGGIQIGYSESGTNYAVKLSSEKAYVTVPWTDTKNTAGSTDTSSKIFLIGATSQAANPQTYSDNEVYVTSGTLTTNKVQIGGTAVTVQYNSTDKCVEFIFN